MEKIYRFTQTQEAIFENVITTEGLLINHVVIAPGQVFPKHPTDAEVFALVVRGTLTAALGDGEPQTIPAGSLVHIPQGILSELGNLSAEITELFVVKRS